MIVTLLKNQLKGNGQFGKYFQISATQGIKIIGRGFKSKKRLFNSQQIVMTSKEATFLKLAEKSKISPIFHDLTIAKYKGKYFPAIIMEHISGIRAYDYSDEVFKVGSKGKISNKGKLVEKYIKSVLFKQKIIHRDLHYNNIIITKQNKIKVIDFSPDWVRFVGKRNYYMTIKKTLLDRIRNN